ncbi:MAG: hypothetical protein P8X96_08020 [Desulfobacteraceae bacterium]|jgi:uncharacterized repeat protein (TIGR01451 family)
MLRLKEETKQATALVVGWMALVLCLFGWWATAALALGTAAGTAITNTVTVDYTLGSDPTVHTSTTSDAFNVVEIIDVTVTWQDGTNVAVNTPQTNAPLTFQVTNTGNGPEDFRLTADHNISADDFDPTPSAPVALWLESNGTIGLQITGGATDTPIVMGGSITLNGDASAIIYLLSDIPGSLADTQQGHVQMMAEAVTPGAAGSAAGTELPGAGVGGNAIVGSTNADGATLGRYEVSAPQVVLSKSIIQMQDPYGGSQPYTSAQVTYRIQVEVTGSGMAETLVITDAIPANTTFVAGSITLDSISQTDADDPPTDNTDFNITTPNAVTVDLGDTAAPATRFIEFSVTID